MGIGNQKDEEESLLEENKMTMHRTACLGAVAPLFGILLAAFWNNFVNFQGRDESETMRWLARSKIGLPSRFRSHYADDLFVRYYTN